MKWRSKIVKVSDLKEYEGNPRVITKKGIEDLKESINKFGIAEPIVVNRDLTIIGGHARKKTLEILNIEEVDVYIPDKSLSQEDLKELNLRLNKNIAGEWDWDMLANEFEIEELTEWGFTEEALLG